MAEAKKEQKAEAVVAKKKEEKKATPSVFVMADGKSVTSIKGILSTGDIVKPEFFSGGKAVFDDLIKKEVIVKG